MNITDLCDLLNKQLQITYYPNQGKRWSARFYDGEVQEGRTLSSVYGDGNSPAEAIEDYCNRIKGKRMVFGAYSSSRQEFTIPENISYRDKR